LLLGFSWSVAALVTPLLLSHATERFQPRDCMLTLCSAKVCYTQRGVPHHIRLFLSSNSAALTLPCDAQAPREAAASPPPAAEQPVAEPFEAKSLAPDLEPHIKALEAVRPRTVCIIEPVLVLSGLLHHGTGAMEQMWCLQEQAVTAAVSRFCVELCRYMRKEDTTNLGADAGAARQSAGETFHCSERALHRLRWREKYSLPLRLKEARACMTRRWRSI